MPAPFALSSAPSPSSAASDESSHSGRRSSERVRKPAQSRSNTPVVKPYPHGPPTTIEEKLFASLDAASFESGPLIAADDILAPIFNNERLGLRVRTIGDGKLSPEDRILIKLRLMTPRARDIDPDYPTFRADVFTKRMLSHGIIAKEEAGAFTNLVLRYTRLLHSQRVRVSHVSMNGRIEARIVAKTFISKGTLLLELGGLMSSDAAVVSTPEVTVRTTRARSKRRTPPPPTFKNFSVIKRAHEQLGPGKKDRLLPGPIRFINHSCAPNCKLVPFPKTHAWGIKTCKDVFEGQEVTISYGYNHYFPPGQCACALCNSDLEEEAPTGSKRKRGFTDIWAEFDWELLRPQKIRHTESSPL